ncbi:MAG: cytochrome c biogenesis protein ResB [Gracilibacteraceae bacterium]|jgi:cytochrome c biogenesis protein|nr:cytochrome c biogenesis protein ResB [Gracilibacteraceae bacterium]
MKNIAPVRKLWTAFKSMKTGLGLLALLIIFSGLGSVLTSDIYRSPGFKFILVLLALNLLSCNLTRAKGVWQKTFRPVLPRSAADVPQNLHGKISGESAELSRRLEQAARRRGYRVWRSADRPAAAWSLVAVKRRLGYWGTFAAHLAFVLLLLGAQIGTLGFSGRLTVLSGETRPLADLVVESGAVNKDYAIHVNSVEDRFLPGGERDNWYTDLSVTRDDSLLARGVLSVNSPFSYDGVAYYQSSYQEFAAVQLNRGDEFLLPLSGAVDAAEASQRLDHLFGWPLGETDYLVKAVKARSEGGVYLRLERSDGTAVGEDQAYLLREGETGEFGPGLQLTYLRLTQATGLIVKADPGLALVWFACGLLSLGLLAAFYYQPLRLAAIYTAAGAAGVLSLGLDAGKNPSPAASGELAALLAELTPEGGTEVKQCSCT